MNRFVRILIGVGDLFIMINVILLPIILLLKNLTPNFYANYFFYLAVGMWSIIFLKDAFNGSSIIKKIFGIKVIDLKDSVLFFHPLPLLPEKLPDVLNL